jgi:hypothetical protein
LGASQPVAVCMGGALLGVTPRIGLKSDARLWPCAWEGQTSELHREIDFFEISEFLVSNAWDSDAHVN